jgi:hypothetical protein
MVKLAAALEGQPLLQARVIEFLEKQLHLSRRGLNKAIKAAVKSGRNGAPPNRWRRVKIRRTSATGFRTTGAR